jgi:uncharacterized protein (TIGR03083 family)
MSKSSAELAQEFNARATEFAELVRGLNDEQWQAVTEAEGWSVGTAVHHVGQSLESTFGLTGLIISDNVPSISMDDIHASNAAHAAEYAHPDKAETLAMIEQSTGTVTEAIAALSDEELDSAAVVAAFGSDPLPVRNWIEMVVIGHIGMHTPSIEAVVNS